MDIFDFLTMLGGLALFLFGMETMGEGLSRLSGGRMERLLERLTSRRIMALLLGMAVTAVIQSSSATTVMVVGFVNSGVMRLSQAVGVIMGANIGTTVTSWLLSLTGVEGSGFLLQMLKPASFSPILAAVGVAFLMFSHREKKRDAGMILVGFGVLMTGMETMSGAVKPLAQMEGFAGILTMFSHPLPGMLAGAALTAVLQSSSASVGILQALCATGAVTFGTAVPIIMGQNVGTCVTALLSGIGAGKNARRASVVHLYFNVIGTLVFMAGFYGLNSLLNFEFLGDPITPAGIAGVHSLFNIGAAMLLFPFGGLLERLAVATIPDGTAEARTPGGAIARLDERFLDKPGVALAESRVAAVSMAGKARTAMDKAMTLMGAYDAGTAEQVAWLEDQVDRYEDMLGTYLVKAGGRELSDGESRLLSLLLHSISDFERISDYAAELADSCRALWEKKLFFSKNAILELKVFGKAVGEILEIALGAFAGGDLQLAARAEPLEEVIRRLHQQEKQRHILRLQKGRCTIEQGFILSDICAILERTAGRCANIAVCVLELSRGEFDTHEYRQRMKKDSDQIFERAYQEFGRKYRLPAEESEEE